MKMIQEWFINIVQRVLNAVIVENIDNIEYNSSIVL